MFLPALPVNGSLFYDVPVVHKGVRADRHEVVVI